ncbi:RNA-binding protein 41 isoform X2 [Brachionichthys hirsutus]|uniref:RNA-binding protein 41 isoform X2 n=1 Tax=Brachionichthys hirsutus TaxID=412623 RepID=UPI0036053B69
MRRVSRPACEDGPLLDEQETEGQRQLHGLLLQQLDTGVDLERCVAKRRCFAPASLYRPFGEQAAGVRSLSQFRALQDGEQEPARLRELGLTEAEVQLWRSRGSPEAAETVRRDPESRQEPRGVSAAPGAKEQRLQVIRDKMEARAELLSRPQRFTSSQPLSRREMEIERALFQGSDRLGFLAALYHRDGQQGEPSSDPMDSLYRDVLLEDGPSGHDSVPGTHRPGPEQSHDLRRDQSGEAPGPQDVRSSSAPPSPDSREQQLHPDGPPQVNISRPIGSLRGAAPAHLGGPLTVSGEIQMISDEEITKNRESDEGIRIIPRFRNYEPGTASKVLCVKNLSAQASVAQLVALFSRFEQEDGPPVVYRLLTGRMKGHAFITLPDAAAAQRALHLLHGYRLLGKPLVLEFGRRRLDEEHSGSI